jgi:hypothetical protein
MGHFVRRRTARLLAPLAAGAWLVGSGSEAWAAEPHQLERRDSFSFFAADTTNRHVTCTVRSVNSLSASGDGFVQTHTFEDPEPECSRNISFLEVSYTNTAGQQVRFELSGGQGVEAYVHDVGSNLETRHKIYFTGCDCLTPAYTLPK